MKPYPSTLAGWIVFYLFLMVIGVLVVWVVTREDIPQMVGNVLSGVIGGFLGVLTGKTMVAEDSPPSRKE